jgi:hypothetical protein
MGGGDGRWFKRSTGEEWPVARDNDDDDNMMMMIIIIIHSPC